MAQTGLDSVEEAVCPIISKLQELGYDGLDSYEPEWVQSVLVCGRDGGARHNLLLWVVRQLSPSTAADLQRIPQHTHMQRIVQTLSCMGVCQPGDIEIIQGSASATAQLRFWGACLKYIQNLRQFSSSPVDTQARNTEAATYLLHHLVHSPHLQSTLQMGDNSFVPGDLVRRYRTWIKQGQHPSMATSLHRLEAQLEQQKQEYNQLDEQWKVESDVEEGKRQQTGVAEALHDLSHQQSLLQGIHTAYIAPWTSCKDQLELSQLGPLVRQAREQLATVTQVLNATEEAGRHCEDLEEEETEAQHSIAPLSTTLHTLATSHNT